MNIYIITLKTIFTTSMQKRMKSKYKNCRLWFFKRKERSRAWDKM